ncbi:MarR family winged helix-turn-helix transcriptional regulator [Flexivirga oryzae]|uniref:DNA-binding MarR family transcriptional regulator n=1 Tax=Flexivirga oryzae TaxID=1794944 RepID=A0A839NEE3_9MICO|nr:MarR family transcriptional regulator [Flexivirga oryzae]MBB2892892.1 DNA-binding MarR family transcriptional regulator [Flexivirga oryzae]
MPDIDLLDSSYYRPLFQLLHTMDQDIERLYTSRGKTIRSRFVGPLITLSRRGPLTVKELASAQEVSHSGMSQTVASMAKAGLVRSEPGEDARSRIVTLTEEANDLIPLLRAEWRSTESVVRALDEEIAHPIMQAVDAIKAALAKQPFAERLEEALDKHLREDS